jgi:hypothetical protein
MTLQAHIDRAFPCWERVRRHTKAFVAVNSIAAFALLTPSSVKAQMFNLTQTLNSPTPKIGGVFGQSVAISGNNALIGAGSGFDSTGAISAGNAYLFDVTTGNLVQTFNNPTPEAGDIFGLSVAISGNNALIGAIYDNTGATQAGSAYLFDVTTGNLLQTFNNPTPEIGDGFGESVAISGNNVLIGALFDSTGATSAGSAYLFDLTTGNLLQTFNNPTPEHSDQFGNSVAISGNNLLIAAVFDNTGASDAGSAYLFDLTTGNLLQTFNNPTPEQSDQFGESVAISGNYVLIGAYADNTSASTAGSAYLFDLTTGNLLQTFNNPTPEVGDVFGISVAISGNNVLIGALFDNTGDSDAGSAYLFDLTTGNLLQTFNNPTPEENEQFGYSVAINGNNALIGAIYDRTGSPDAGSAYLYAMSAPVQDVPGPLPLLGAGAAFGWSRKMRRMIGMNRNALT